MDVRKFYGWPEIPDGSNSEDGDTSHHTKSKTKDIPLH
jgi:hypothetical protein